ncbi:protease inhibitor I42 family protein [Craterilacuibacter sp.]|uniref:protease inhibitor I42 family protein n=1 Tax=Craterilacuibacter sp. TaxID=2870909 RepID=UPI003F340155
MKQSGFSVAMCLLLLGGCASVPDGKPVQNVVAAPVAVGEADNGLALVLQRGQVLLLSLPANPSTGYDWQVSGAAPLLVQQGEAHFVADRALPGSSGVESWRFIAKQTGVSELVFAYRRPWEKNVALRELRYRVQVR